MGLRLGSWLTDKLCYRLSCVGLGGCVRVTLGAQVTTKETAESTVTGIYEV